MATVRARSQAPFVPGRNCVWYDSEGDTLAGHLFLPPDFDQARQYPAIVFVRPATGVKEQTAGLYAERLAARGFVTLAFDPRGFGESQGRPLVEDPFRIVRDTYHSITFIERLPFVSREHIFSAGVCMGASYAPYEATQDPRVKGVASITPYLTFHLDYPAVLGGRFLTRVWAALTRLLTGLATMFGVELFWYVVPTNGLLAAWPFTLDIARGMRAYYLAGKPGFQPTWRNRSNLAGFDALLAYDPFTITHALRIPYYMAYGTAGYSPALLQRFFDDVQSPAEHKRLRVVDGTHFEIYWQPRFVDPIVDDIATFFGRYVAAPRDSASELDADSRCATGASRSQRPAGR